MKAANGQPGQWYRGRKSGEGHVGEGPVEKSGMAMIRVLHVISGLFHGGGQRVVEDLVTTLPQVGEVEVRLCTLGKGARIAELADCVVKYDGRYNRLSVLLRAARELRSIVDELGVDIVHTHGLDADLFGAVALRRSGIRQICHLHISPPSQRESWRGRIRRWLLRRLAHGNQTWFIAVSEAVREQMIAYYGLPARRVVTVRNGIDIGVFGQIDGKTGKSSGSAVAGTAARLAPMKGLEYLIDAAARLQQRGSRFELRIAGTGSLLPELRRRAEQRDLGRSVRFVGHVEDMAGFYQDLDLFVLPSVSTEGLPLTVLEAMASGLPVVATDVGGTAEAVRHGIDGLIVPPRDAEALAGALANLLNSPERRQEMGRSGRQRVADEFSRERVATEVHNIYCRVLGRAPALTGLST